MNETNYVELIAATVDGDLVAFARLLECSPAAIDHQIESFPTFTLKRSAVRNVLLAFQAGTAPEKLVQAWASFVRRGYFGWFDELAVRRGRGMNGGRESFEQFPTALFARTRREAA